MKTSYAVWISIFIAVIILISGLIFYIFSLEIRTDTPSGPSPLMEADIQSKDAVNDEGEPEGTWGYVEISDEELLAMSAEELLEFADQYVKNSDWDWFSITTPGGAGIYFPDADYEYAEYGILDEDGKIASRQAVIHLEGTEYIYRNDADAAPEEADQPETESGEEDADAASEEADQPEQESGNEDTDATQTDPAVENVVDVQ